jgi:hypothetical protein
VNLTFSLPFGGNSMDELVVQQSALGYVQTILQQYNLENLDDAFVEYRSPKFVDAAMTVYAVGLTRAVMNNAQRALFLQVFRQGFDPVLASRASQAPMAVYDASVLYQIPPLAADEESASTASDESIRNRLDANNSTNSSSSSSSSSTTTTPVEVSPDSASAPLTSNLAVRVLVRATCSGPDCHDGTLATALWEKGRQHADAWATGIREQAGKASNAALRTYFGPLVTIVVESPTDSSGSSPTATATRPGWTRTCTIPCPRSTKRKTTCRRGCESFWESTAGSCSWRFWWRAVVSRNGGRSGPGTVSPTIRNAAGATTAIPPVQRLPRGLDRTRRNPSRNSTRTSRTRTWQG